MVDTHDKLPAAEAADVLCGVLAEFAGPEELVEAAAAVREAGYRRWDCHSPYPLHGIDRAMGIRMTPLPWLVLGAGIVGAAAALLMQWWMNAVDYPFLISAKPLFGIPANIAITFELIVLFSGLTAFFGAIALNRLPQLAHPLLRSERFRRVTSDGMFLWIEAADPRFDPAATSELLHGLGATAVELCYQPAAGRAIPRGLIVAVVVLVALAPLPPLLIARARSIKSTEPRIDLIQDMGTQPKYRPQASSSLFADGRAMRLPVPGTIAEGRLDADDHLYRGKLPGGDWASTFPLPVNEALMNRGQDRFNTYCAPCHGQAGMGDGMVSRRAIARRDRWIPPLSLHVASVRDQPVGQLFHTVTNGIRTMPAYASQVSVEDRWAIILYVRALQRSQHATLDDVPRDLRDQLH
jgi:mono/diheme cytochrome c family protein